MTRQELDNIQKLFINSDLSKWKRIPNCDNNMFAYYGDDGTHLHVTIVSNSVALIANNYLCFIPFDVLIIWGYDILVESIKDIAEYVRQL